MTTETTPVITTAIVPVQRVFRKAREVIKSKINTVNPKTSELNFDDFTAKVDTNKKEITLAIVGAPSKQYDISGVPPFTYTVQSVKDFVFNTLGFSPEYKAEQKEQVQAALPEGLSIAFGEANDEGVIEGTVTVDLQVKDIEFANSITSAALFLEQTGEGATCVIKFHKDKDPVIDLGDFLLGGNLDITKDDLLMPIEEANARQ